jgi:hypothetical protein
LKKSGLLLIVAALLFSFTVSDVKAAGKLVLNGSGVRTKMILGTMYSLALYVPEELKGKDGKKILEANDSMYFVLLIQSSLITRARFLEATSEGFGKSAAAGYASAKKQAFLNQFNKTELAKGDIIVMSYTPAGLTTTYRKKVEEKGKPVKYNDQVLGTIAGIDLKKALFAIWLGPTPIQDSLKASLLAGK